MEISTYRPREEKEIQRCVTAPRFPRDPRGGEKGDKLFRPRHTRPDNFSSLSMMRHLAANLSCPESKVKREFPPKKQIDRKSVV